jgi:DNA topoisomerase-1
VSRAQDAFILFGNRDLFFSKRALTRSNRLPSATLGRYMREHGKHLYPRILVVLESPNKIAAVQAALGKGCKALATTGHFRNIADIDFATMTPHWSLDPQKESNIRAISTALDDMDELVLATDDDQEGEAIAWHVLDALNGLRPMDGIRITRMTFHEVTHRAISQGFARRSGPWYGSQRADAGLTRAIIDKVLADSLTQTLTTAMNKRGYGGTHAMGRVRAALLELLEHDADNNKNEYAARAEFRFKDAVLRGYLVEKPTDFEPLLFASPDEARQVVNDLKTHALSDAAMSDVTRFSLGLPEPSSTAEVLIRAYDELDGMMPDKTYTLLQHLYEGSS